MNNKVFASKIKGYPGYTALTNGEIYSEKNNIYLKPRLNNGGYQYVNLYFDGLRKSFLVHRLVMTTFSVTEDDKKEVNHIDGDKLNNNISNLEWVTPKQNIRHSYEHGLRGLGEKSGNVKLRESDVLEIRVLSESLTIPEIAKKYDVHVETIRHIIKRMIWKHI